MKEQIFKISASYAYHRCTSKDKKMEKNVQTMVEVLDNGLFNQLSENQGLHTTQFPGEKKKATPEQAHDLLI